MWQQPLEPGQDIRWRGAGTLPWVKVPSPGSPSEAGLGSAEGGNNAPRVLLLPLPMPELVGTVCL
jgi:hypothetical protein